MFKRFRNPRHRLMDLFGLKIPASAYDEFWALRDISVEVRRGERLALIGRNGAGKSTLLNLVCGQLRPTEGRVQVQGEIQALMELGTGFHPEFSGRENVISALAYQGLTGRKASQRLEEIVDFAELWEFIDFPLKTYSAGMNARLGFAVATAIEPDILIVDEVLGAGDAYFASKCADRMRELTEGSGATVLFVSHDLASAQQMCERALWIDRGHIRMQGSTLDVTKAYYASIIKQEEARLLTRTQTIVDRLRRPSVVSGEVLMKPLMFRFVPDGGDGLREAHPIRKLTLSGPDGWSREIAVGTLDDDDQQGQGFLMSDRSLMLWSSPVQEGEASHRCVTDTGGQYGHAPFIFTVPEPSLQQELTLAVDHASTDADRIGVELYLDEQYVRLGHLTAAGGEWRSDTFVLPNLTEEDAAAEPVSHERSKWNTRYASIVHACSSDEKKNEQYIFQFGEPICIKMVVNCHERLFPCWIDVVFYDERGNRVFVIVHNFEDGLSAGVQELFLKLDVPKIRQGEYMASVELVPEFDYYAKDKMPFYSHWDRCLFVRIDEKYQGAIHLGLIEVPCSIQVQEVESDSLKGG